MATLNIAAYGQGSTVYPLNASRAEAIRTAGWTTIILGLLHVDKGDKDNGTELGDISFSDQSILVNGQYVGDGGWPRQLRELFGDKTTITNNLIASIGGGPPVKDFQRIKEAYENKRAWARLERNFAALFQAFTTVDKIRTIDTIEMDMEETYDKASFVAFCRMVSEIGFKITFCPYDPSEMDFWADSLKQLQRSRTGPVKWWDLQCYEGGKYNNPQEWADAIKQALPDFDTNGFIMASDWSRFWDDGRQEWRGHCPPAMQDKLVKLRGPSVGGAFVWNIGQILSYAQNQQQNPDPEPCGNVGMSDYVEAIAKALG